MFIQKKIRLLIDLDRMTPISKFLSLSIFMISLVQLIPVETFGGNPQQERIQGFSEHNSENAQFNKAREMGEKAFLEEVEQWETQRDRKAIENQRQKQASEMTEDGVEAKEDATAKRRNQEEYKASLKEFLKEKSRQAKESKDQVKFKMPNEAQELGLDESRPRYEFNKRMNAGKKKAKAGSSASSSGSGNFPQPPSFDGFSGGGGGYVPAPNLPEDFGDVPPPPMNPGFGEDSLGGGFGNDFPPPPPPPPPFGEF